jgi:hypothetical protein
MEDHVRVVGDAQGDAQEAIASANRSASGRNLGGLSASLVPPMSYQTAHPGTLRVPLGECQGARPRGSGLVSNFLASPALRQPCYNEFMPTRARKTRSRDANVRAFEIVQEATGQAPAEPEDTRNPAAVALAKLGASKGGKARAAKLSAARRKAIAKKAVAARWAKKS